MYCVSVSTLIIHAIASFPSHLLILFNSPCPHHTPHPTLITPPLPHLAYFATFASSSCSITHSLQDVLGTRVASLARLARLARLASLATRVPASPSNLSNPVKPPTHHTSHPLATRYPPIVLLCTPTYTLLQSRLEHLLLEL